MHLGFSSLPAELAFRHSAPLFTLETILALTSTLSDVYLPMEVPLDSCSCVVIIHLMCQSGWSPVPRLVVKYDSGLF